MLKMIGLLNMNKYLIKYDIESMVNHSKLKVEEHRLFASAKDGKTWFNAIKYMNGCVRKNFKIKLVEKDV